MIRVTCSGCGSQLNAKDELAGQTRKCPKCRAPIVIPSADTPADPAGEVLVQDGSVAPLTPLNVPERLAATSRYLICDNAKLVASWEGGGQSWMLKTHSGWISAARNPDQLPNQGDFKLIELRLANTDDGLRLDGITSYQLAPRWALSSLGQGDHQVLSKVTGPGGLSRRQKDVVRQTIMDQFMHPVWKDADRVLEYLANADYHSPGTG